MKLSLGILAHNSSQFIERLLQAGAGFADLGAGVMMLIVLSSLVTRFAGVVAPGPSAGAGFGLSPP